MRATVLRMFGMYMPVGIKTEITPETGRARFRKVVLKMNFANQGSIAWSFGSMPGIIRLWQECFG
jgi:hypothetical protein